MTKVAPRVAGVVSLPNAVSTGFAMELDVELIKQAVTKAKAAFDGQEARTSSDWLRSNQQSASDRIQPTPNRTTWNPPVLGLDPVHLERNRIVSFAATDPSHIGFNLLRTKLHKTIKDNDWKGIAITSPTSGCGKTMVAINLAFSLARQPACKTVLVDLDLRKCAMARTLGVSASRSIGQYLEDEAGFEDCFVQVADNLILGLNNHPTRNSAELIHHQRLRDMLQRINDNFSPDVTIFDLPPMLASDDALAFLPSVDSVFLVVAAGRTTAADIEECERQASSATNFLGVVLNKAEEISDEYYHSTT